MIPRLYPAGTVTFTNEGLGALVDCISCETSTAINGIPELNITYPTAGRHADEIGERCIIVSDRDRRDKAQPYIIRTIDKSTPGIMEIYAIHLVVDIAEGMALKPFTATNLTDAIDGLTTYAVGSMPITITTTRGSSRDFNHLQPSTVKDAMGGKKGSILDVYGGEWRFLDMNARNITRVGANNGVIVRYGKNLESLSMEVDWSVIYTGIYPFWVDGETGAIKQMASPVYSLGTFSFTRILMLDCSSSYKDEPTDADLLASAQAYASSRDLTNPKISWNVIMKELRNSPEYADVALLEDVALGDTVGILFEAFNVNASARIVSERFDVLREQYNELVIGSVRSSLASSIVTQEKQTEEQLSEMQSSLEAAIQRATDLITGNIGGYIVTVMDSVTGTPKELLIMNDPDITAATKVWRWNLSGLGYSSNGYAGPYTTAITQNGEIVADFITTGTLDAAVVNVINLIAEHVRAVDGTKVMDINAAQLTVNNGTNWRTWLRTDQNDQGALILYGGKRTNLTGIAVDPGNDSTSYLSYIDPHGIGVGLNYQDKVTGNVRAQGAMLENNGYILLKDSSDNLRIWADGSDNSIWAYESNGNDRWRLTDTGNLQLYYNGKERVGLYPQEGQISLYNSSSVKTVQIRGDGTASTNPLPINQGGTGATTADGVRANLDMDFSRTVSAGSSLTLTVADTTRFMLCIIGGGAAGKGLWLVNSTSSGAVTVGQVFNGGSTLSVTTGTNSLTISNGTSVIVRLGIFVFGGSVS